MRDPDIPERPPLVALRAIEQIRASGRGSRYGRPRFPLIFSHNDAAKRCRDRQKREIVALTIEKARENACRRKAIRKRIKGCGSRKARRRFTAPSLDQF